MNYPPDRYDKIVRKMLTVLFSENLTRDDILYIKRYFKLVSTYRLSGVFTKAEQQFINIFSKYPDENKEAIKIQTWFKNLNLL